MKRLLLCAMIGLGCMLAGCKGSPSENSPPAAQDPDGNMANNAL